MAIATTLLHLALTLTLGQLPQKTTPTVPTTATSTTSTTTTSAAGEAEKTDLQEAIRRLPPIAVEKTRGGVTVVSVGAPAVGWTSAGLRWRFDERGLTPKERASTTAFVIALAEVGQKTLGVGGRAEYRVSAHDAVVLFGADSNLDLSLKALDQALRAVGRRPSSRPTGIVAPTRLEGVDGLSPALVRGLMPGDPAGLAVTGEGDVDVDARTWRSLAGSMTADRVVFLSTGPGTAAEVAARTLKLVTTTVGKASGDVVMPYGPRRAGAVFEARQAFEAGAGARSSVVLLQRRPAEARDRAATRVLAALVGGAIIDTPDGNGPMGIVVDVVASGAGTAPELRGPGSVSTSGERSALMVLERDRVAQLRRIGEAPPPPEVVALSRDAVLRGLLQRLREPGHLLAALGRAALQGDANSLGADLDAVVDVGPSEVALAAARVGAGDLLTVRQLGSTAAPNVAVPESTLSRNASRP